MEVEKASGSLHHRSSCRDEDEVILPGFRFHPTDEELVGFYLRRKVEKKPISIELIKQIDIYKYDPWDLPRINSTVGDKEMYFFCIRGRKYRNSIRPNRVTGSGFWKATGIDKPIYSVAGGRHNECIGLKKSLVYYRGNAGKGTKTDWMMHEFRLPLHAKNSTDHHRLPSADDNTNALEAEVWTLCRIFKRNISFKKYIPTERQNPNKHITCDHNLSSVTDNFELFDNYGHQCLSRGGDSMGYHQMNLVGQVVPFVPTVSPNSSSWCTKEDEIFEDKNWDELQSVVDLAINDPTSHCYRYR